MLYRLSDFSLSLNNNAAENAAHREKDRQSSQTELKGEAGTLSHLTKHLSGVLSNEGVC